MLMIKPTLIGPVAIAGFLSWPSASERPVDGFDLLGSASVLDDDCVRLTPDAQWASGAAWSKTALDLAEPFDIELGLGFGHRDELGADGIVFALTQARRTGFRGEGLGYAGLRGSVGIELDTYQNRRQNDPSADHLALVVDGFPYHATHADLVPLPNLEDGRRHALRVRWSPADDALTVDLDGQTKAIYPGAILRRYFGSDATVSWGLTAGTGRKTNAHVVCFERD